MHLLFILVRFKVNSQSLMSAQGDLHSSYLPKACYKTTKQEEAVSLDKR